MTVYSAAAANGDEAVGIVDFQKLLQVCFGIRAKPKYGSGNKSNFFTTNPFSDAEDLLKASEIQSYAQEMKGLNRSDTELDGSDLTRIKPP